MLSTFSCCQRSVRVCGNSTSFLRLPSETIHQRLYRGAKTLVIDGEAKVTHENQLLRDFSEMPGPPTIPLLGSLWDFIKPGGLKFTKMFEAAVTDWLRDLHHLPTSNVETSHDIQGLYNDERLKCGAIRYCQNFYSPSWAEHYKARAEQYGPVYREQLGRVVSVIVSDPEQYQKVIHNEPAWPVRAELGPMAHYRRKKKLGLGLVNSQGEEWYTRRIVLSKKMLRPAEVVHYCEAMSDVADDFVDHLETVTDGRGQVDDLKTEVFKWALESVGEFLFDTRLGCYRAEGAPQHALDFIVNLQGFFAELQEMLFTVPLYKIIRTPSYVRFERHFDKVLEIGQYYVNQRAAMLKSMPDEERDGFVWYLLGQKQLPPGEANLNAIEMMTGGVETVSNALLWALLLIARNPDVQEKLVEEMDSFLVERGRVSKQDLQRLPYLKAFLKETFRYYPITFATSRFLQKEMEIGGYLVPKGVQVQANLYGIGHDKTLFPDPHLVRPERWMRQEESTQYQAFSNLVWGHGPRMCIGRRLAEQELRIALIKILQKFKLSWRPEDEPPEPILHTVMTPDRPMKVCFTPRESANSGQAELYVHGLGN